MQKLIKQNPLILILGVVIFFVICISCYQLVFNQTKYIFVETRVNNLQNDSSKNQPGIWFIKSLHAGDIEKDILGSNIAELEKIRYYPSWTENQYDIYLTLKIKVKYDTITHKYSFQRSTIAVGSPIDIVFPNSAFSGTITEMSTQEIKPIYVDKTITLVLLEGYSKDFPYRYDDIQINDFYYDGEDSVFQVLDKKLQPIIITTANYFNGSTFQQEIESKQHIIVRAKVKVEKQNQDLIFGKEYHLVVNANIPIVTSKFNFQGFVVRQIEN